MMIRRFAACAAVSLLSFPAWAIEYDTDRIKSECTEEWGTEYDMVKYCIDQRRTGFETFTDRRNAIPEEDLRRFQPTIDHCQEEWQQEWNMTAHCLAENLAAVASIPTILTGIPDDVAEIILNDCSAEWSAELNMVAYCATNRVEGWRAINR